MLKIWMNNLPTGERMKYILPSQSCQICLGPTETLDHLLESCDGELAWTQAKKVIKANKLPQNMSIHTQE